MITKDAPVLSTLPKVSVVSVNWNQAEMTAQMAASLFGSGYANLELLAVDNGSTVGDLATALAPFPNTRLIRSGQNLGFAGGNNLAFPYTDGQYVLLLNNDTEVAPGFLHEMVALMEAHPRMAACSPKIFFYDQPEVFQFAGASDMHPITGRGKKLGAGQTDRGQFDQLHEIGLANGACMLVRREVLLQIGGFDEQYFLYYEEHDLCTQFKKLGYTIGFAPKAKIWHKVSASSGKDSPLKTYFLNRNRLYFIRKHRKGITRMLAIGYYLFVAVPKSLTLFAINKKYPHIRGLLKGLAWHLSISIQDKATR